MSSTGPSATRDLASASSSHETTRLPDLPQDYPDTQAMYTELERLHGEIDQLLKVPGHNLGDENVINIQGTANGYLKKLDDLFHTIANEKATLSVSCNALSDEIELLDKSTEKYEVKSTKLDEEGKKSIQLSKMAVCLEDYEKHIKDGCNLKGIRLESTEN